MNSNYTYHGFSLVDLSEKKNLETTKQVISLRTQILNFEILDPKVVNLDKYEFGESYKGQHNVWEFNFEVEYLDVYFLGADRYGALKQDFKIVPVITNLSETVKFPCPIFYVDGIYKNIYFRSTDK